MTQYQYQTDLSLITKGELSVNGSTQLVAGTGPGTSVVVGNPPNSTPVPALISQGYSEEVMDVASAQTLGQNFVFLNGTSFDSMGVGVYEFEESNGFVYGLYGRTDGLNQQLYFSGAPNNRQDLQYTTVPYVPPFLSSSIWQASCICGSDLEGFVMALRDTTPGSTAAPRYLYVKHNGSLINTAGHTYVEITPVVQNYVSSINHSASIVPKIVRVGQYFFICMADWLYGTLAIGGWNAQDSTYPQTSAALPSSPGTYTPQTFTITTSNMPGGDYTTGQSFPVIMGNGAPGGLSLYKVYNVETGALTNAVFNNMPQPIISGWATNIACLLEGEVDSSGNPYLAVGTTAGPGDSNGLSTAGLVVYTAAVTFTAGSPGAWTNAQLTFVSSSANGGDTLHMQPPPFILGANPNFGAPQETVASNPATPSTCANKLPVAGYYMGQYQWGTSTPSMHWYYSGAVSMSAFGNAGIRRGVTQPAGNQYGSLAAARANKLAQIYPMFNVNHRTDFSPNGAAINTSFFQPSGIQKLNWNGHVVGPDLLLTPATNAQNIDVWVMCKLPTNSNITDHTYNRFGSAVPGFGPRVAEYPVNLPRPSTTSSTWGCLWPSGMADPKSPVSFNFPTIADAGVTPAQVNGASVRLGSWSLSGGTYQPPPVVWTYASNMTDQLAAIKATAIPVIRAEMPTFGNNGILHAEVIPVLNSSGSAPVIALCGVWGRDTSNNLQLGVVSTPCGLDGSTINLTNTASATIVGSTSVGTSGVPGGSNGSDLFYGRLFVVYSSTPGGQWYVQWTTSQTEAVAGDAIVGVVISRFDPSSNISNGAGLTLRSQSRSQTSCSVQHQGLGIIPYRNDVGMPEVDMPLARYSTTATATQDDLSSSFIQAMLNPSNIRSGTTDSNNLCELMLLSSLNNSFLIQLGAIQGKLNHKQYNLPSTFIDMTNYAVGTYYLYLTDTGSTIELQVDSAQRPESSTSMYFGRFDRTSTGFANQSAVSEVIRFGTARLVAGSSGQPMQGSQIRVGPYVG